jgi:hypothetical protein
MPMFRDRRNGPLFDGPDDDPPPAEPYGGRAPSVAGSATSEAAADSKLATKDSDEGRVYGYVVRAGERGATNDEIEAALGLIHQNASARTRTLVLKGRLRDSGRTRATRSGRQASVWVATARSPL